MNNSTENSEKKKKKGKPEWLKIAIDIWNTQQYRSAIKLVLYLVFVAGVLIYLQFNFKPKPKELLLTPMEKYEQADNYEYRYSVIENNSTSKVEGSRYEQKEIFHMNDLATSYLIENSQIYEVLPNEKKLVDSIPIFNMEQLKPNNIVKIIEKAKKSATTEYTSGEEETTYQLSVSDFSKINGGNAVTSDELITIKVMMKEEHITKISLDLTNYRKLYVPQVTQYLLTLEYFNYNKVEAF